MLWMSFLLKFEISGKIGFFLKINSSLPVITKEPSQKCLEIFFTKMRWTKKLIFFNIPFDINFIVHVNLTMSTCAEKCWHFVSRPSVFC